MIKLLLVIGLSLALLGLIFGMTYWVIKTSTAESRKFKGIPKNAEIWIKGEKGMGYLSLFIFFALMYQPNRATAGAFLLSIGIYFIFYGVAIYKAEVLESMGFGITYYGKVARYFGIGVILFGLLWFLAGLGGSILN